MSQVGSIKFKDLSRISRVGIKFKDFKDFFKDMATLHNKNLHCGLDYGTLFKCAYPFTVESILDLVTNVLKWKILV